MKKRRKKPWLALAIALSLGLHVVVFVLVRRAQPLKNARPPLTVELVRSGLHIQNVQMEKSATANAAPTEKLPARRAKKSPPMVATETSPKHLHILNVQMARGGEHTTPAATEPENEAPQKQVAAPRFIAPPSLGTLALEAPKDIGGHTTHTPASRPSNEQIATEAQANLQAFFAAKNAQHRVELGLVHPYFSELQKALAKTSENPPPFHTEQSLAKSFTREWLANAASYGAGLAPNRRWTDDDHVVTLVDLRQKQNGEFVASLIVASSGYPAFDAHVLQAIPKATAQLTAPLLEEGGLHKNGLHSLWAFEGALGKKIAPSEAKPSVKNLPALLLAPLEILSGRADELALSVADAAGAVKTVYLCEPHLLAVY